MRFFLIIGFFLLFLQDDVPMLSADEYSYKLDYSLKQKQKNSNTVYDINEKSHASTAMLPFVQIHFTFKEFREDDKRIRVYQGEKLLNTKKIKGGMVMTLEMGFSADLKEGIVPPVFQLFILNDQNQRRGQIRVEVKSNGELLINNVPSGLI